MKPENKHVSCASCHTWGMKSTGPEESVTACKTCHQQAVESRRDQTGMMHLFPISLGELLLEKQQFMKLKNKNVVLQPRP